MWTYCGHAAQNKNAKSLLTNDLAFKIRTQSRETIFTSNHIYEYFKYTVYQLFANLH